MTQTSRYRNSGFDLASQIFVMGSVRELELVGNNTFLLSGGRKHLKILRCFPVSEKNLMTSEIHKS